MPKSILAATAALSLLTASVHAHAIVGERVFPATLAVEDPGVSDEFTLPQVSVTRDAAGQWGSETEVEFAKEFAGTWAVSLGGGYASTEGAKGYNNIELGLKHVFYTNAAHELMLAAALEQELGHSGSRSVAAGHHTTTPVLFFGKGMGDLPVSLSALRPLAFTGTVGWAVPWQRRTTDSTGAVTTNPQTLTWGGSLQYSLPYLAKQGTALPGMLGNLVPLVEVALETPTSGPAKQTTGTVNPGVLWVGEVVQVGVEAVMPLNQASGRSIGALGQLHFYLDDLFPH